MTRVTPDTPAGAAALCKYPIVADTEGHPHAGDPVFDLHVGGKMQIAATVALDGKDDLSLAYTPGVALVCEAIAADPSLSRHYTWVPNVVGIVTDGTADATANEALFQRELDSNLAIATQLQLNATPTWIVGDQLFQGQIGYDGLKQAVAKARAAKS